jgi:uncharacterized protein
MEERDLHIITQINERFLATAHALSVQIKAIYVFGSFGTQYFRTDSDIDLGVLADRPLTATEKMTFVTALDLPGGHVVDLIDLLTADLEMQDIIISPRKRIYADPSAIEEVEDYEHRVWVTYLTLCDDRKEIIEQIKKTGIIYGPDYIEKSRIHKSVHKAH